MISKRDDNESSVTIGCYCIAGEEAVQKDRGEGSI